MMNIKKTLNNSRRKFLKEATIAISVVAMAPNLVIPTLAQPLDIDLGEYKPSYFSANEWAFILAATDRLIPADATGPGALDTNVPVFIDKQMQGRFGNALDWYMQPPFLSAKPEMGYQSSLTPAQTYRQGIKATEDYCHQTYQKSFAELSDSEKDMVLSQLQLGEIQFSDLSSMQFFSFLLQNTKEGYFADPIHSGNKNLASWKMIGFPGARASFKEWVAYPNVEYPLGPVSIEGERG
ncbi:gluconate 2-dehydrogenase subunit 3 family protein [Shewanella polaris]|nr:gluconate 2-dehydrogenase subunit 3 family protein [Shewanella polaris]